MSRGRDLIEQVTNATGLPQELVQKELIRNIKKEGLDPDNLSLDELRVVLAEYLQEVFVNAKDEYSQTS